MRGAPRRRPLVRYLAAPKSVIRATTSGSRRFPMGSPATANIFHSAGVSLQLGSRRTACVRHQRNGPARGSRRALPARPEDRTKLARARDARHTPPSPPRRRPAARRSARRSAKRSSARSGGAIRTAWSTPNPSCTARPAMLAPDERPTTASTGPAWNYGPYRGPLLQGSGRVRRRRSRGQACRRR